MQVVDEVTKKLSSIDGCRRVVVNQLQDMVIYGYTKHLNRCVPATLFYEDGRTEKTWCLYETMKDKLFFSNKTGVYYGLVNVPPEFYISERFGKNPEGIFPYKFEKRYEAIESFDIFKGKQEESKEEKDYPLAKYLKYSFGLEFETSFGLIPEAICFRDGLIPLRDGSISGLEYSTVVMSGNKGLALLERQLKTLKERTHFNKECSLHVHLGGFPLDSEAIFRVYQICYLLQNDIQRYVPRLTFNTAEYKKSGKDYCKRLDPYFGDFNKLYRALVGRNYMGSLLQPHPADIERKRKWQINTRYYWVNFINILCYKVNKTIEFRFLRPTYNYRKITLWLYVMNAILLLAENKEVDVFKEPEAKNGYLSIHTLLGKVYPPNVVKKLTPELYKLMIAVNNQSMNGDDYGRDIEFEEELFDSSEIL